MHVALWSSTLPDSERPTGILTYVKIMREALIGLGHRVTVLALDGIALASGETLRFDSRPDPLMRIRWKLRGLSGRDVESRVGADLVYRRLRQAHRIEPIDILEIEESFGWAAHLARRSPCPIVVRLHGPTAFVREPVESEAARAKIDRKVEAEGRGLAAADAISSPSARLLEDVLSLYAIRPAISGVIANPMGVVPPGQGWDYGRCDPRQLINIGRFDLAKGADIMLQSFAIAGRRKRDLKLLMIGIDAGIMQPDGSRLQYDAYAAANLPPDIRERVQFLGPLPQAEVTRFRLSSAMAVVTSRFETFGYATAESMALGAPTLVAGRYGLPELLRTGSSQHVLDQGDATALADAMIALIDAPDKLRAMGDEARDLCGNQLAPTPIAEQALALYRRTISGC